MAFVVKIKFGNTLRRLIIEGQKDGSLGLTFIDLVEKIRNMFHISPEEKLVLTYIDQDNDLVTMGHDHDLYDACIIQKINPLRIHVNMGDVRIQELKEALQKSTSTTAFTDPHENHIPIGLPVVTNHSVKEEVRSIVGTGWRNEISPHKMQANVHSYRQSVRAQSRLDAADHFRQGVLQTSHRREDHDARCGWFLGQGLDVQSERTDQFLPVRKHHHRMTRAPGGNYIVGKLDARFVCDITIFDGTELVSGTQFTKIWRLRNIGTLPWPPATRLVYTGGDLLGTKESAFVELPEEGLRNEEEMNIAVDFVAPVAPGRYVSHWRLRAPSGQKFGQRVWVLIKVVSTCGDTGISQTANENRLHQGLAEQGIENDSCRNRDTGEDRRKAELPKVSSG